MSLHEVCLTHMSRKLQSCVSTLTQQTQIPHCLCVFLESLNCECDLQVYFKQQYNF